MAGSPLVDLAVVGIALALIFPAELPDKTFLATLVLSTRFRPLPVWTGVSAAFGVQCLLAVSAGQALALLPRAPVLAAAAALFAAGAVLLFRAARPASAEDAEDAEDEAARQARVSARADGAAGPLRAAGISFLALFLAEFGDLSQLLTAGLVVRYRDPVSVFAGSWLALATLAGIAVLSGKALLRRVRASTVRRLAGSVCAVLAVLTALEAAGRSPL